MSIEIRIPELGESVVKVTIGTVLKASGSFVKTDEELVEIETDKLNQVIVAPSSGTITWVVRSGDVVSVKAVIGHIAPSVQKEEFKNAPSPKKASVEKEAPKIDPKIDKVLSDLPPARKPSDAIFHEGKEIAQPSVKAGERRKKMSSLRQTIAKRLVQVKNETAMLTTFNEIDMSAVMQVRAKEQESFQKKYGVKLGFMSFFIKAATAALQEFPEINGRIEGDEIVLHDFCDMSVAVSTDKGLFVPVIRNAQSLSYAEIEKDLQKLAEKARNGTIALDDLRGGTFTITNAGLFGSLLSTPILNPPQSGILGMHNIVKRAVVVDDAIVIRPMMYVALSYDHRIVDGKQAVSFLMHMKKNLEEPARLLLDL